MGIKGDFNLSIIFPDGLEYLEICGKYNKPLILPDSLQNFTLDCESIENCDGDGLLNHAEYCDNEGDY